MSAVGGAGAGLAKADYLPPEPKAQAVPRVGAGYEGFPPVTSVTNGKATPTKAGGAKPAVAKLKPKARAPPPG